MIPEQQLAALVPLGCAALALGAGLVVSRSEHGKLPPRVVGALGVLGGALLVIVSVLAGGTEAPGLSLLVGIGAGAADDQILGWRQRRARERGRELARRRRR